MVVPWIGFPLSDLLARFEPNSRAKYVEFRTLADPEQMEEARLRKIAERKKPTPTSTVPPKPEDKKDDQRKVEQEDGTGRRRGSGRGAAGRGASRRRRRLPGRRRC